MRLVNLTNIQLETTTVWSFPVRGSWATHNPGYRGNFAPQVPHNLIQKYSLPGETVFDPMMGSGTTLIEARLLNRNGVGVDINPATVQIANENLQFSCVTESEILVRTGDVRNLDFIENNSIDLIVTHPPYLDIIKYSDGRIPDDLSNISNPLEFCLDLEKGIKEMLRVLKPGKYCAVLIGDTRRARHYIPLAFMVMRRFLECGFVLKEDIIKIQHNCRSTPRWSNAKRRYDFYLIMHEHLFVFRKPGTQEDIGRVIFSTNFGMG